jgi:Glycosyltransferase family 9 (heptosyltransferase)
MGTTADWYNRGQGAINQLYEKAESLTIALVAVKFSVRAFRACMEFDFNKLKDSGALNAQAAFQLALRAADQVISHHRENRPYAREAVALLCEMTADAETARAGVAALFPSLIERLNDSFDPRACSLYDRVMAQVIDFYRRRTDGERLDAGLRSFGLVNEADLLRRKREISNENRTVGLERLKRVGRVLLLSRVTIGADVAVTSVITARLREVLPGAEFVILGSHKLRDLYGGDPQLRIREIAYERTGGVLSRLHSWLDLVQIIDDETRGLKREGFLLIDPDSRLTQLGLLPLLRDERNYYFFESRGFHRPGAGRLGELASLWADDLLGAPGRAFPYVDLLREHRTFGQEIAEKMRRAGASHLVTVSLGVGGNPNKRISDSFERELIRRLLEESTLILDKGASPEEREQIDRIVDLLREQGKTIREVNEQKAAESLQQGAIRADVLTWDGGIGRFAGLIAASDQYIGYDSAGQHIAAALGVPTLTIFVNSNSPAFAERWQSYGPGVIKFLNIDVGELKANSEREKTVLLEIMAFLGKFRAK